jgi:hypothetical protein
VVTKRERGDVGDIIVREMAPYARALAEAGYDWAAVWSQKWTAEAFPEGTELWWLRGRFLLARECAGMANVRFPDEQLTQFCRERLEYDALHGGNPPRWT